MTYYVFHELITLLFIQNHHSYFYDNHIIILNKIVTKVAWINFTDHNRKLQKKIRKKCIRYMDGKVKMNHTSYSNFSIQRSFVRKMFHNPKKD